MRDKIHANVHFVLPNAAETWPMVRLMREGMPSATFDCGARVGFGRYRHRVQLLFRTPSLAIYALRSWLRRVRQFPLPDFVCVGSDAEIVGCLLARFLSRKNVPIVLNGFIYTPRRSRILTAVRKLFFRTLLARTAAVICYSQYECRRLPGLLGLEAPPFVPVLFGGALTLPNDLSDHDDGRRSYIVAAGRSGRDYALLANAVRGLPIDLKIICDSTHAIKDIDLPPNATVVRNCYGLQYYRTIANAEFVVIPLADLDLSSGQMVLIDAMALGKASIVTRTETTIEYGQHCETCYFVDHGSVASMRSAIALLLEDRAMRERLGNAARQHYLEHHTLEPYIGRLVGAVAQIEAMVAR